MRMRSVGESRSSAASRASLRSFPSPYINRGEGLLSPDPPRHPDRMSQPSQRVPRPPGAVVSEKGSQTAPLPSSFLMEPASGDKYTPQDVFGLPRPMRSSSNAPLYSILSGNPVSPDFLNTGDRLTVANLRHLASRQPPAPKPAKRPKNLVKSNNSTFIARGVVFDTFAKRMRPEEPPECLVLENFDRSLALLDYSRGPHPVDTLVKILFASAWPLCHALNDTTASGQQLDVVVGMSSGDLVWLDLISQRYERINKSGNLTHAAVLAVAWMPGTESLVVAAHADGLVVVYDLYGEDANEHVGVSSTSSTLLSFHATAGSTKKRSLRAAYQLFKPGVHINALQFVSPSRLVIGARNDYLRVFDFSVETTTELWPTLFGGVYALAVSPDGRFLCSGGEDDLISIFDLETSALVVRLSGHKAWVRSIAFDPFSCEEGSYRIASIGEDQQVILWDFSPTTLTVPKWRPTVEIDAGLRHAAVTHPAPNQGPDSHLLVRGRTLQAESSQLFPATKTRPTFAEYGNSPLSDVAFTSELLLVASGDGRIWSWQKHAGTVAANAMQNA